MANIRSVYAKSKRYITPTGDLSLTQQQFKDECDLNLIIEKCSRVGAPLPSPHTVPTFIDTTLTPSSLQEAMEIKVRADYAWDSLPVRLKERFRSVDALLEFCSNPSNHDECVKLGLMSKPMPEQLPVVSEPPSNPVSSSDPSPVTPVESAPVNGGE